MREYKNRARNKRGKRFDTIPWRIGGNRVSTDLGKRKFRTPSYFYGYDWSSWTHQFDIAITWYGYKLAITAASITAFFTGIGQIFFKLIG